MPKQVLVYMCLFATNAKSFDRFLTVEPDAVKENGFTVAGKHRKFESKKYYATTSKKEMMEFKKIRAAQQKARLDDVKARMTLEAQGWKEASATITPKDALADALAA